MNAGDGGLYLVNLTEPEGPWEQLLVGGGGADRGLELHLVWTEISSPHPPTHWLGGQAAGLSPEGQLAWAWRLAGQAR